MGTEIERKFLVVGEDWKTDRPTLFRQGYLNRDEFRTVRVRVAGDRAMLTVKGKTTGMTRAEYEYDIPVADAVEMLDLCEGPIIEKQRWLTVVGGMTWEVDEFFGDNAGLIVAEIELDSETQKFEMPNWVGEEVTHDDRYFNSSLTIHPFQNWT